MLKRVVHLRGSDAMLGAERVVLELSRRTAEFGYESVIWALQGEHDPEPELVKLAHEAGIQTEILRCRGRFDPAVFRHLRQLLRSRQAELLHCHGYKENFYGLFAARGLPKIATNHLWKRTSRALRFYCWLDAKLIRHFDHVVAVSEPIQEELRAAGVPAHKITRIANGIDTAPYRRVWHDTEREAVRASLGILPERLAIGMVSQLSIEKGHVYALDAIAQLRPRFPQLLLVVIGDGPELPTLQAAVTRQNLEQHVLFCGRRSDIADVMRAFDIFLLPSLLEGLPMALLEAMATGQPAVASHVGDVDKAIQDGMSGLLVPPANPTALAAALARLAASPDLRLNLGRAAADRINQQFSARQMARQYCRLYDSLQRTPTTVAAWEQEQ